MSPKTHLLRRIHREAPPGPGSEPSAIRAEVTLSGADLKILFEVTFPKAKPSLQTDPSWPVSRSTWGIWEKDVVELFLAPQGNALPYFELVLTPLGQWFEQKVLVPRKQTLLEPGLEGRFQARIHATGWTGEIQVPLTRLGWTGRTEDLVGGLFSCHGPQGNRTYWAAFLDEQARPDFHLPEFFRPLL